MLYIDADAITAAAKHKIVLEDRTIWFALIPRDIRRLILEFVPCHVDACSPKILCERYDSTPAKIISREVISGTNLPESYVIPRLTGDERYAITCYSRGVVHSETRPAVIRASVSYDSIYWRRNGMADCSRGYYSRHKTRTGLIYLVDDEVHDELHETYADEVAVYGDLARSYEEWQVHWKQVREADPWPIDELYG